MQPSPLMRFAAALLLLAAATLAAAQMRTLPENAERGTLTHVQENVFTIDGKIFLLRLPEPFRRNRGTIEVYGRARSVSAAPRCLALCGLRSLANRSDGRG